MQQIALFGNAADRFFLTLEEPPEDLEMTVTEELYQVALKSRLAHGEPDDYDHFEYQEQQMERPRPPEMILTMGYTHGYERRFPQEPKNKRYMLEFTWGEERRRSEHRDNTTVIFESAGSSNYSRRGRVGGA